MNMKILKLTAILLLLAVCLSSCSKKKEENYGPDSLIAKWKMEKVVRAWNQGIRDMSQYNIMYEFSPDGIMTVTGVTDDVGYVDFKSGEYLFSILTADEMDKRYPLSTSRFTDCPDAWWFETNNTIVKLIIK